MSRRVKNIYKVSQSVNCGYDTYDSMVVVANNADEASKLNPSEFRVWSEERDCWLFVYNDGQTRPEITRKIWCHPKDTTVELIGVTDLYSENQVILSSFNAG